MDDLNNGVVYLNDAGTEVVSHGTTIKNLTLDVPIVLGSGELFGLLGDVLIYASTDPATPSQRKVYIMYG
jgi:hypothetical protein